MLTRQKVFALYFDVRSQEQLLHSTSERNRMKIYHYTDLNGLKGIIENNSLWATNLYFLNDSQELLHGMECIKESLPHLADELGERYISLINNAMNNFDLKLSKRIYNISFCLEPELLSQWRGYASTQGVCLEFNSDDLIWALDFGDSEQQAGKVIYTEVGATFDAKNEAIAFFKKLESVDDNKKRKLYEPVHAANFASRVTPFFKHYSFREEKEFRIAIYKFNHLNEIKFRVNKNGLIPYMEVNTDKNGVYGGRLPLDKVTIGPSPNADFMQSGIRLLLDANGYRKTEIAQSTTPYRG